MGEYQAYNASIAIEAVKYILPNFPKDFIDYALANIFWPGRMEYISKNPKILIDGGHNIHAIKATVKTLSMLKGKAKIKVLFSALYDKDYKKMIEELNKTDFLFEKKNYLNEKRKLRDEININAKDKIEDNKNNDNINEDNSNKNNNNERKQKNKVNYHKFKLKL